MQGISFTSLAGQTTAIVGSTGAGKTTLVNLVARLFDVTEGQVLVDGVDVRDMGRRPVAAHRPGPRSPTCSPGTVASNLRYGKPDATEDEMWEALAVAEASEFVAAMHGGLHARIAQGGTNVSGGQRQRLAIAPGPSAGLLVRRLVLGPRPGDRCPAAGPPRALDLRSATVLVVAQRVSTIAELPTRSWCWRTAGPSASATTSCW